MIREKASSTEVCTEELVGSVRGLEETVVTLAQMAFSQTTFAQKDICPERHLPRKTFAQKDICPERHLPRRHLPRRTFAQKDICPERHLPRKHFPRKTSAQKDICPERHLHRKTFASHTPLSAHENKANTVFRRPLDKHTQSRN